MALIERFVVSRERLPRLIITGSARDENELPAGSVRCSPNVLDTETNSSQQCKPQMGIPIGDVARRADSPRVSGQEPSDCRSPIGHCGFRLSVDPAARPPSRVRRAASRVAGTPSSTEPPTYGAETSRRPTCRRRKGSTVDIELAPGRPRTMSVRPRRGWQ